MCSNLYERIILSIPMRPRTLIDDLDPRDVVCEDDVVLICLRHQLTTNKKTLSFFSLFWLFDAFGEITFSSLTCFIFQF